MANYSGLWRSNYFQVKEPKAFLEGINMIPNIEVFEEDTEDGVVSYCLLGNYDTEDYGIPSSYYDHESGDEIDFCLEQFIGEHITDNSVAVLIEVGNEKLKYLNGYALAISSKEIIGLNLDKIYDMAKDAFGIEPSRAEY